MMKVHAHVCVSKRAAELASEREGEPTGVQVSSNCAAVRTRTLPLRPYTHPHAQPHAYSGTRTHTCPRVQDEAV